jgi:uncharacterized protein YndB with AHSA1/START domain
MRTVRVERTLDAPIEAAFDLLTDHAAYKEFPGISDSELLKEGATDRNGVGAVRRVIIRPLKFVEEITAFERPTLMSYLITGINVPLDHEGGTIELTEAGDGTQAVWTSTFRVPIPVIGGAVERAFWSPALSRGFGRVLYDIGRRAS